MYHTQLEEFADEAVSIDADESVKDTPLGRSVAAPWVVWSFRLSGLGLIRELGFGV